MRSHIKWISPLQILYSGKVLLLVWRFIYIIIYFTTSVSWTLGDVFIHFKHILPFRYFIPTPDWPLKWQIGPKFKVNMVIFLSLTTACRSGRRVASFADILSSRRRHCGVIVTTSLRNDGKRLHYLITSNIPNMIWNMLIHIMLI